MKNLNNYILEKLRINKDTKIVSSINSKIFYIIPRGEIFDYCNKNFKVNKVGLNNEQDYGFLAWDVEIKLLIKKLKKELNKYPKDLTIYGIPKKYEGLNSFINDIQSYSLTINELTKIDYEEFE